MGPALGRSGYRLAGPLRAHLVLTPSGGGLRVEGRLGARLVATCHRCLCEFPMELDLPVEMLFSRLAGLKGEVELGPGDMDVSELRGDELDTTEVIEGRLAEELPLRALCSEDCRGLCQGCGRDLNQGPCTCAEAERVDPRLAVLRGFRVRPT